MEPGHRIALQFTDLALAVTGRHDTRKAKAGLLGPLSPLLEKLGQLRKKA